VARLAGEIESLKRPMNRSSSTPALNRNPRSESLISTKLGKILLKSLSDSLQKIAVDSNILQEEDRMNPLSPDNLTLLKNQIAKLSKSIKVTKLPKEKIEIVKSHKIEENALMKEREDVVPKVTRQPHSNSKDFQSTTHHELEERVLGTTTLNNRLIPQILEDVGNSVLKPPSKPLVKETEHFVPKFQPGAVKPTQGVPAEVNH